MTQQESLELCEATSAPVNLPFAIFERCLMGDEEKQRGSERKRLKTTGWQVIRTAFRDLGIKHSESEAQRRTLVKVVRGKLKAIYATGGISGEVTNYPATRLFRSCRLGRLTYRIAIHNIPRTQDTTPRTEYFEILENIRLFL
jgi:hypothetical protein